MTREQQAAKGKELAKDIGKKVLAQHHYAFRSGDTAEIVGWGYNSDLNRFVYYVRYEDGECDFFSAEHSLKEQGYIVLQDIL